MWTEPKPLASALAVLLAGCLALPALAQESPLARAEKLAAEGDLDGAASLLRSLLAGDPSSGPAHRALAEVLELQGDADGARRSRRAAYDAGLRHADLLRDLGRDLLVEGSYGLAARVLLEADEAEPLPYGPRKGLALALARVERYEEAVEQLGILLALDPGDLVLLTSRARAEMMLGDHRAALADVDAYLREKPDDIEAWLLRGKVQARMGRFDAAVETFEKVLALDPPPDARSIAQADIGSARGQMGDAAAAEAAYRRALSLDPGNVIAAANLSDMLVDRDQEGALEAEVILRTALNRAPEAALLFYQLGKTLLALDRAPEAETQLRAAVRLNPTNPRYHYQLALALHRVGKIEEAEREMKTHKEILERYRQRSGKEARP